VAKLQEGKRAAAVDSDGTGSYSVAVVAMGWRGPPKKSLFGEEKR